MNRVLVIRGGAIGDFVLTLPAIKLLRDAYPQARLEILGYKHIAALAEKRFYADAIRSLESGPLARFFAAGSDLPEEWVAYFGSFDLVVSYLFDPDEIFAENLRRSGVKTLIAISPKIVAEKGHATAQLAVPLQKLGLKLIDHAARLYPSTDDREFARRNFPDASPIALHPGSGSARKNWPLQNWIALLDSPVLADTPLVIVGGEADREQIENLRALGRKNVCFAENLPLTHLAAVLERCRLFFGHDSGISHLAAAVGTPCRLMFGPTDPEIWAPRNENVRVLRPRSGDVSDLTLCEVSAHLKAPL